MDIMDMTLRQILQAAEIHPIKDLVLLGVADNVLAGACGAAGWTKGETFFLQLSKFVGAILVSVGKKIPTAPKAVPILLATLTLAGLSGCASAGLNSSCGHVQGNEVTIPYVGGKADGDVMACHIGCFGMNCPKPDYQAIADLTAKYISQQNTKMSVPGPGTITYTPDAK